MRQPPAFRHGHVGERRPEGGILCAAGVHAEADILPGVEHVADAHLLEGLAVTGALDAVVVPASAEAVPHGLDVSRDCGCGPVRISVVCHCLAVYGCGDSGYALCKESGSA